jgi:hypothetical protein
MEELLRNYQQAADDLAQCFEDELAIRPESSLLNRVVVKILVPFAAVSATLSAVYTSSISWAKEHYPSAENALGVAHLLFALCLLLLWLLLRETDHFPRIRRLRDHIHAYLESGTPGRTETLTRNRIVNDWIYVWFVFGAIVFVPAFYFLLRANAFDRAGLDILIDTAGICQPGSDGISVYRGSETCASITGTTAAASPQQAEASEIRLDATTTLAFYAVLLVLGVLVAMGLWWHRERALRHPPT